MREAHSLELMGHEYWFHPQRLHSLDDIKRMSDASRWLSKASGVRSRLLALEPPEKVALRGLLRFHRATRGTPAFALRMRTARRATSRAS